MRVVAWRLSCTVLLILGATALHGHGGGLDSRGCHNSSDTGRYHCHQGRLDGRSFRSEAAARDALGGGGGRTESASRRAGGAYDRDAYGDWRDADGDCQSTRDEVLIEHARSYELGPEGCDVVDGVWRGPYTGERLTNPSQVHIDHVVPLKEVHISGAASWPPAKKRRFANDSRNLLPAEAGANMSKGASGPADWLPDRNRCAYVERWARVKREYQLDMDRAERQAIQRVNRRCP